MVFSLSVGGGHSGRPLYRKNCYDFETSPEGRGPARGRLPAVVAESAVRFGHAVRVFALLDRIATIVRRVEQFARQARGHRGFAAVTRGGDQPADRERLCAFGTDFDRNLIGRTADARSEEHTSELQSLMRISYAVFCLKKKTTKF